MSGQAADPSRGAAVLSRPLVLVLALACLGFTLERLFQPVIPLLIMDRGGNAVVVGLVAAIYAAPSVVLRPLVGRFVDGNRERLVLRLGAGIAALAPIGLLIPTIGTLAPVRFVQGGAWTMYSVSTQTLMAKLAPPARRGEASGYYSAMQAVAVLIGPTAGAALYVTTGAVGPALAGLGIGVTASLLARRLPASTTDETVRTAGSNEQPSGLRRYLEPSALPATAMITLFMSSYALFTIFPPVFAATVGASPETLTLYYPVLGSVMLVSQVSVGRASDRLGRGVTIRLGCGVAILGLIAAALADTMAGLLVAGALYGVGVALVAPTLSALTIDRAPAHRLGSAMATYSIGFQLATGAASLVWGPVIVALGFSWAFVLGIGFQLLTVAAGWRFAR